MASVNKVMILGNLTRDPELRYTPQGAAVCEVAVALNRSYMNKTTNQKVEEVSFIDCVLWGKTGEIAAQFLTKGRQVHFEGYLKQDRWETPDGQKRNKLRVVVERMTFVGGKPTEGGQGGQSDQGAPAGDVPEEDIPF